MHAWSERAKKLEKAWSTYQRECFKTNRMLKNSLGQNSAFFRFLLSEAEVHFVVGAR
jgi:hypothetical protein